MPTRMRTRAGVSGRAPAGAAVGARTLAYVSAHFELARRAKEKTAQNLVALSSLSTRITNLTA